MKSGIMIISLRGEYTGNCNYKSANYFGISGKEVLADNMIREWRWNNEIGVKVSE
jgi:hypothetical protein